MENLKDVYKDLPQLIVALDSLGDEANYIHINDVKKDVVYYCPCCKGIIKPRAYKNDRDYQVQPHFYHENGGCNEETFLHFICKTWLFENGCKFKVDNQFYEVEKIETEKTYHTSFGDYRPDITVYTTCGKIYFFEIKFSNSKSSEYIPKWDELERDVVEVDVRYFINQKHENDIPEFRLIYSNGECFIKSYTRKDYDDLIAKRKLEWKRQDKLNYKMMWEKLDWFWINIQDFKAEKCSIKKVKASFRQLPDFDKELCYEIIKKMSCIKEYNNDFRYIINSELQYRFTKEYIQELVNPNITITDVKFNEKESIYIYGIYKINSVDWAIDESHHSKEWIFRCSEMLKLIEKINNKAKEFIEREQNIKFFNEIVYSTLKDIKGLLLNRIWEINYLEPTKYSDFCNIDIHIKNAFKYGHRDNFYIFLDDVCDMGYDDVNYYIIEKLAASMNKIRNYIIKNDGIGCEYRHVFIGGTPHDK